MSQSLLLEVARQSITEVLEASRHIDAERLKEEHPILNEKMATAVTLYLDNEVRAHHCSLHPKKSLLDDLIHTAKIAAFESEFYPPISTSQYLHVSIQVSILTPLKLLSYQNIDELLAQITPFQDGVIMSYQGYESYIFPDAWSKKQNINDILRELSDAVKTDSSLQEHPEVSIFQIQNAKDKAILC